MTDRTKAMVLAALLAPVLVPFLLAASLMAGQFLCARIYRGDHEGVADLCGIVSTLFIFFLLLVGAVAAVVVPLHRFLGLKQGPGVRKSHSSR